MSEVTRILGEPGDQGRWLMGEVRGRSGDGRLERTGVGDEALRIRCLGPILLTHLLAQQVVAEVHTVRWLAPAISASEIVGYRLYSGTSSRVYSTLFDLGLPTPGDGEVFRARLDVPAGQTFYLAMTSYDPQGLESEFSSELVVRASTAASRAGPPDGSIDSPLGEVWISAGQSVNFMASASGSEGGPYAYSWSFAGAASGNPDSTAQNPGWLEFSRPGHFLVSLRVTDSEGNADPTPATIAVHVTAPASRDSAVVDTPGLGSGTLQAMGAVSGEGFMVVAPPNDPRVFVLDRQGKIRIVEGGFQRGTPFLDLGDQTFWVDGGGLLAVRFDPDYARNGHFFVSHTDSLGDLVLSRFTVSDDPYRADVSTGLEILRVPLPQFERPGGGLAFGTDGFLFLALGDGGGQEGADESARDRGGLLGTILRIDVAGPPHEGSLPGVNGRYAIPLDNPFLDDDWIPGEVWALGLRNPDRLSVDRLTGDLWVSDGVGSGQHRIGWERGDHTGGDHYGWNPEQATVCGEAESARRTACGFGSPRDPTIEWAVTESECAVSGGFVYRGAQPEWQGEYFFVDACTGQLWSYDRIEQEIVDRSRGGAASELGKVESIGLGRGGTGEIYLMASDNGVYKLGVAEPECSDRVDNDADGLVDYPEDPGCSDAESPLENPLCDDGFDNDGDGVSDFADPQCRAAHENIEAQPALFTELTSEPICGLGAELVVLLPLWLRVRSGR